VSLETLAESVIWASREGMHVAPAAPNHGVCCTSSHAGARWERDPRVASVDVIGAAILHRQPDVGDLQLAASLAVGEATPFVEGMADGLAKEAPSRAWTSSIARGLYAHGWETGSIMRAYLLRPGVGLALVRGNA
jgi:hypothetical protein